MQLDDCEKGKWKRKRRKEEEKKREVFFLEKNMVERNSGE